MHLQRIFIPDYFFTKMAQRKDASGSRKELQGNKENNLEKVAVGKCAQELNHLPPKASTMPVPETEISCQTLSKNILETGIGKGNGFIYSLGIY